MINNKETYFLTKPQKSIWNMENFFEGTNINNICANITILDNVQENILKKAIQNIVKNHDSFRIKIIIENNTPVQYISDFKPFNIEVLNINNDIESEEIINNMKKHKFNIIDSDLFYFKILKYKDGHCTILFSVHHLIADSWSLGLFAQAVVKEYYELLEGSLTIQEEASYIDYINSEEKYKNSNKYILDKKYWEKKFTDIPENISFPSYKMPKNNNLINSKRESFRINFDVSKNIKSFCETNKISTFNFFMAIYSIYLKKVSGLNEFVIGTPLLNRTNFLEKQTMGMFINTIPVKINFKDNINFFDFTHELSINLLNDFKHQKYSYTQILEDLREKNSQTSTLFNVSLSYQITKAVNKEYGNYITKWHNNNFSSTDCTIHINDLNDTGELFIDYDYLDEKYDLTDIRDLHSRIEYLITQVLNNNTISINDIDIVPPEEKNKILNQFNNTEIQYPTEKNFFKIFEDQVENNPQNTAVIFENNKITYKELDEKSTALANNLLNYGINSNDVIAILLDRSIELIIAIFGVIKTNASYVLIDTALPEERINYILKDSKAKLCICNEPSSFSAISDNQISDLNNENSNELLKNSTINNTNSNKISEKLTIDNNIDIEKISINKLISISEKNNKTLKTTYTDNLCIIYTSGSTGNPKGVLLNKSGYYNLINAFDTDFNISQYKKCLSIATISFDMFVFEIFSCLLFGNTLILANYEEQKNPIAMSNLIKTNNVEFFVTTPSRAELLLLEECNNPLKDVKAILFGGEKFTSNLLKRLRKVTNAKLFNSFGPTEITSACTNKLITSDEITIGKPLPNMQIYICEPNLKLLPIGVVGEICVAGKRSF